MFVKLSANSTIVGMDFLESIDGDMTIFTKNKNSIVASPSFIDVFSMLSGIFTKESVDKYIEDHYAYDSKKIKIWVDSICDDRTSQTLWGSNIKDFSLDYFKDKNLFILSEHIEVIDCAIVLAKYGFSSIFVAYNRTINDNDIDSSVFLGRRHLNKTITDVLSEYCINTTIAVMTEETIINIKDVAITYRFDSSEENCISDFTFSIEDYRKVGHICEEDPFKMDNDAYGDSVSNFMLAFNIQNDILLSIFNGIVM